MVSTIETRAVLVLFGREVVSFTRTRRHEIPPRQQLHAREQGAAKAAQPPSQALTFLVNSLFLHECYTILTKSPVEHLHAVTGSVWNGVRTLDRVVPLRLSEQSVVGAKAEDQSLAEELIRLNRFGLLPLANFHSHPGRGVAATQPSATDRRTQAAFEKCGSQIIGLIFPRDGCLRFYANGAEPVVQVVGKRIREVEKNVFQLETDKNT